jgi:hypothetical protein
MSMTVTLLKIFTNNVLLWCREVILDLHQLCCMFCLTFNDIESLAISNFDGLEWRNTSWRSEVVSTLLFFLQRMLKLEIKEKLH